METTMQGTIIFISDEMNVGQKETPKISFVIEETWNRQYKDSLMIDLMGDKTNLIKEFKVGDVVAVSLNFRAREYNWRWFNSINAWKIDELSKAPDQEDLPF
jgi:Protein of unknown function (DUF3127).